MFLSNKNLIKALWLKTQKKKKIDFGNAVNKNNTKQYHDRGVANYNYLHLYILGKGTLGNGTK